MQTALDSFAQIASILNPCYKLFGGFCFYQVAGGVPRYFHIRGTFIARELSVFVDESESQKGVILDTASLPRFFVSKKGLFPRR